MVPGPLASASLLLRSQAALRRVNLSSRGFLQPSRSPSLLPLLDWEGQTCWRGKTFLWDSGKSQGRESVRRAVGKRDVGH